MNNKEIKAIDELTKINIELKQKCQEQQRILDKIKEIMNEDDRADNIYMKLRDYLEEIE